LIIASCFLGESQEEFTTNVKESLKKRGQGDDAGRRIPKDATSLIRQWMVEWMGPIVAGSNAITTGEMAEAQLWYSLLEFNIGTELRYCG
jgi:hypothetical protein